MNPLETDEEFSLSLRNAMYIPDPTELSEDRMERMIELYEEGICMGCAKKVNYQLMCATPLGDGPALCDECLGITEEYKL